jgi:hypothetical protein
MAVVDDRVIGNIEAALNQLRALLVKLEALNNSGNVSMEKKGTNAQASKEISVTQATLLGVLFKAQNRSNTSNNEEANNQIPRGPGF